MSNSLYSPIFIAFLYFFCKISASRIQNQIYLSFVEAQPNLSNISASRIQNQIYLGFVEAQPDFLKIRQKNPFAKLLFAKFILP